MQLASAAVGAGGGGSKLASLTSTAAVPTSTAGGGGSKLGSLGGMFGIHHTGMAAGLIGSGRAPSRYLDFSAFMHAPRFHTGGVVGADEVPIIAQKGEGVFTKQQMAAIGNAGHQVAIHNNITLHSNGGTDSQNADLAQQVGSHVERIARSTVTDELRNQMRPANMLNSGFN